MRFLKSSRAAGLIAATALALVPTAAQAGSGGAAPNSSGGTGTGTAATVPGSKAKLVRGRAVAPASAPREVRDVIAAANKIRNKPYIYGGGHGSFRAKGYDCSGAVSFALHGARFLRSPARLERPGAVGRGRIGQVDLRLRGPEPRLHGGRRIALRHVDDQG